MKTKKGVGWIVQVQLDGDKWVSWTQWKKAEVADKHVRRLLDSHRYSAGRVVRVDWTIVSEVTP